MAPQPYPAPKHARSLASSSSTSSPSTDAVINIVFGLCAICVGAVTIWQAWRTWRGDHRRVSRETAGDPPSTDIDLEPNVIRRPSGEQAEDVSVHTPSAFSQDFDNTSAEGITGGLTDSSPSSNSATHSTSQDMMSRSTSDEDASLRTNSPLGCRPVLEDLRL